MLFRRRRWVQTPAIPQAQVTECGVASLAIILAYHGRFVHLEELRRAAGVSRDGTTAVDLLRAAQVNGLAAQAHRAEPERLAGLGFPLIVHLDFIHFVVVEGVTARHVLVNDPASGQRDIPWEEFNERYTGIALTFAPTAEFQRAGAGVSVGRALVRRLVASKATLLLLGLLGLLLPAPVVLFAHLLQRFVDEVLASPGSAGLVPLGLGMLGAAGLLAALGGLLEACLGRLQDQLRLSGTRSLLRHLRALPAAFFSYRYPGVLRGLVLSNDSLAHCLVAKSLRALLLAAGVPALAVALFAYEPHLAALVLVLGVLHLAAMVWLGGLHDSGSRALPSSGDAVFGQSVMSFERLEMVKTAGRDDEYFSNLAGQHARALETRQSYLRLLLGLDLLPRLLELLTVLAVLGLGAWAVARGQASVGAVVALHFLALRLLLPLRRLLADAGQIERIKRLVLLLEEVYSIPCDPHLTQAENSEPLEAPTGRTGPLVLRQVSFGYAPRKPALIEDVCLEVRPGMQLGIVGASGSGKSTLAQLLVGLHRPWLGQVELDGCPLEEIPPAVVARSIAWVGRSPLLFEGTVRENLTLWDPAITEEDVERAVRDAELADVLAQRGEGTASAVAHEGRNFSGGQRVRLELARVLARKPALLVVDEAFDALDAPLERAVRDNLRRRGCALVLISRRRGSLEQCDQLVRLEQGRLTAVELPWEIDVARGASHAKERPGECETRHAAAEETGPIDPWLRPCRGLPAALQRVAQAVGEVVAVAELPGPAGALPRVEQLARHVGLRVRRVRFRRPDWWQSDHGPLVALRKDGAAVALLPAGDGRYAWFDPQTDRRRPLTAPDAAQLEWSAYQVYGRAWQRIARPWHLFREALAAGRIDLRTAAGAALLAGLFATALPLGTALLFQDVARFHDVSPILPALAGLALSATGLLACAWLRAAALERCQARVEHVALATLWERVVRLPVAFLRRYSPEDLARRADSVGQVVSGLGGESMAHLLYGVALPLGLAVLAWLSFSLAGGVCLLVLPAVVVPAVLERRVLAVERLWFREAVRSRSFLLDLLTGMPRLRLLGSAARLGARWEESYRAETTLDQRRRRLLGVRRAFEDAYGLLVLAGLAGVAGRTGVGAAAFAGGYLAALQCLAAGVGLGAALATALRIRYLLERLAPLLQTAPEPEGKRCGTAVGTLETRNIHFRYEGSMVATLEDVSVHVEPGEVVALVGPSGSGKSTLLRVLLGFEQPQRGEVHYNGVPLAELDLHDARRHVGAVLQEDRLWGSTVRYNIGGNTPHSQARLWQAAREAGVERDIRRWPMQMQTLVDDTKLSGGQRQQLLLAAQALRQPRVVLLDESTSALDEETQGHFFAQLRAQGRTCLLVAHRPSTARYADRVYFLQAGRIVRHGRPTDVLGSAEAAVAVRPPRPAREVGR